VKIHRALVVVGLAFAGVVATAAPSAQQPPPPQTGDPQQRPPVFRGGVDSVSVDVIVTSREGEPVTDLAPENFEVREDGKVQAIDTFRFVRAGEGVFGPTRSGATRQILSVGEHQTETSREDNRLFAIFLDDYHVRRLNSLRLRQQLANWVMQLQPHDLVAIVYPLTPMRAVTFSRNHDATAQSLMMFEGRKYDYQPKNQYEERLQYQPPQVIERERNQLTMTALEGLCVYLGGLREGRKSVIFVSEGFAGTLPNGVFTRGSPSPAMTMFGDQQSGVDDRMAMINSADLQSQLRYVYIAASRANTAIYSLDPRGAAPTEFSVEDRVDPASDRRVLNESIDTLHQLANETEGRPIVGRNDPAEGLDQILTDTSAYYLLSYVSSAAPRDGKFHRIDVKVDRRNVEVRARNGYWAYTPEDVERALAPPKPEPPSDVTAALTRLVAVSDGADRRPLVSWIGARRASNGAESELTFVWEATGKGPAGGFDAISEVTLAATAGNGDELYRGPVAKRDDALRPAGVVQFNAPPGPLSVRITATNSRGVRIDSTEIEFDVPDFTRTDPLITTPEVFRARTARDVQLIRAAADPVPAANRTFLRSERLLLRFEAYGPGGTVPDVTMELLNRDGKALVGLPAPNVTEGNRFEAVVGLGSLPPGDYLFSISASSGDGTTTRHVIAIRVTS
jgi:VWFA-related protein